METLLAWPQGQKPDRCQPRNLETVKLATEVFVEDYPDDIRAILRVLRAYFDEIYEQ